jgi:hypothetical protein
MEVVLSSMFDDPTYHLWYTHHLSIYNLLRYSLPFCHPLSFTVLFGTAKGVVTSHMTSNLWPGVLRSIDLW